MRNTPRFYPYQTWEYVVQRQALCLFVFENEKEYNSNWADLPEPKIRIGRGELEDLIEYLKENAPLHISSLRENARKEDLKIIHKLLDIQEKMVSI